MFNIEARMRKKNDMVFWGAWLNNIGTLGNSIWKATLSKEALEKKEQRWKSMKAEDAKGIDPLQDIMPSVCQQTMVD